MKSFGKLLKTLKETPINGKLHEIKVLTQDEETLEVAFVNKDLPRTDYVCLFRKFSSSIDLVCLFPMFDSGFCQYEKIKEIANS